VAGKEKVRASFSEVNNYAIRAKTKKNFSSFLPLILLSCTLTFTFQNCINYLKEITGNGNVQQLMLGYF